jgi:hypothetical protein
MTPAGLMRALTTLTSATGYASYSLLLSYSGTAPVAKMMYGVTVYIPTLSTVSEEYRVIFGFTADGPFSSVGARAVTITYDRVTYGNNWQCITRNSSTNTVADSGVAVAAGSVVTLAILFDNSSQIRFAINGTVVATNTTNIPALSSESLFYSIRKSAGTTARLVGFSSAYALTEY